MKFEKYNSLENSYRKKFLDKIAEQGHSGGNWIVQEKVHGANFSLWCDGNNIQGAKRSGFVGGEGADFYNSHVIRERYWENIMEIFRVSKNLTEGTLSHIVIYGELFGGNYPHPDVEKLNYKAVQKGIFYSPNIEFIAYDLKIFSDNEEEGLYQSVYVTNGTFREANLPYIQTLSKGSLENCLEHSNEFKSTIPAYLGYPELEEDNICEGIVIRPIEPAFLWSGNRVLIKNKNPKWSETNKSKKGKIKTDVKLSPEGDKMMTEILTYVTENRLKNVLSKFGPATDKDFGNIMGKMNQDVIEDFQKDFEEFNSLEKTERKYITKKMGSESADLLRANFLNIIDGEF